MSDFYLIEVFWIVWFNLLSQEKCILYVQESQAGEYIIVIFSIIDKSPFNNTSFISSFWREGCITFRFLVRWKNSNDLLFLSNILYEKLSENLWNLKKFWLYLIRINALLINCSFNEISIVDFSYGFSLSDKKIVRIYLCPSKMLIYKLKLNVPCLIKSNDKSLLIHCCY